MTTEHDEPLQISRRWLHTAVSGESAAVYVRRVVEAVREEYCAGGAWPRRRRWAVSLVDPAAHDAGDGGWFATGGHDELT
jgi:hypothetical protein